ncbi:NADPH-dependent FMN reductase [Staphylococcus intermedius]|uniref:FMN-dependent NADPH-azoreductase n=1 Tax=Staphylococcus intermedius NCTC 11048 TaxID=1141106 RepID=A0A380G4E2_STAIN|nr:NADPH-dependent FMN reductase [Staphylococcus intermedius]PNZ51298.1 FMN reductase (NADPH) [Staphylococcus intermedius NCTC 11048]SUM45622.1 FMN reductase NADPH-dependent [Staphylococcus intermedius NCTC 11048]
MAKVTIIAGGQKVASRLTGVIHYAEHYLNQAGIDTEVIQVHQLHAKALITADFTSESINATHQTIEASDGIIIVSPVFKAADSGILKTYLDLLPRSAFASKTVLPLAVGGSFAHVLALQYSLDPVIKELGADTIHKGRFILDQHISYNEDGTYSFDQEADEALNKTLKKFVNDKSQVSD